jgi:anti-sigma regulatory factor (Ser/Thr protein kinase)
MRAKASLSLELACNDRAPAAAREALRALEGIGWILGDAMLVTSELIANAVTHSGCDERDTLEVTLEVRDECLFVSVWDPGTLGGKAVARGEDDAFAGLGLKLVGELCRRWGAQRDGGHRVWGELAL